MYIEYYGFREKPFSLTPDPSFLYPSRQHSMAAAMLEYALTNQAPIAVITGEIGAGKTTLLRQLLDSSNATHTIGLISNTHSSLGNVLEWVLGAFGIDEPLDTEAARFRRFTEFVISEYARGQNVVLIVDEAQNLSVDSLEQIRLLSNVNADKDTVLQLVLVGQPELRDKLRQPELKQLAQRVAAAYHLGALSEEESASYINHRLHVAGAPKQLFSSDAIHELHEASKGIPRLLNILADTALVYGFAMQADVIGGALVAEVISDRRSTGLFEEDPSDA